jgi:hypothetical protein
VRVRGFALKAWHMHISLPGSFVTAKGTVLFTAPPASAWQLCLPVLYLIPPARLVGQGPALKEISLPDPGPGNRGFVCPPWWCESRVCELAGRRAGAHARCYSRL